MQEFSRKKIKEAELYNAKRSNNLSEPKKRTDGEKWKKETETVGVFWEKGLADLRFYAVIYSLSLPSHHHHHGTPSHHQYHIIDNVAVCVV